jgi:phosphoribosylformylglycinamidine synthase
MTVGIRPEHLERFMALSEKHAVESTVIGEYTDSGFLRLDYRGKTCAYIRMDFLNSDFPQWEFDADWVPPEWRGITEPVLSEPADHRLLLREMLARPNLCDRSWIQRQYDHEVQGGSVVKPLVGKRRDTPSDASVVRPVLGSMKGIAVSQALNPWYSQIDTYHMTAATIDEAVRRVLAVGGDPEHIGGVDNFCWPTVLYHPASNPDGKYKAAQLVRSNWALRDYCLAYGIPLLSGKDSMYIDGNLQGPFGERRKVSGLPALLFTVCSVVPDTTLCVTMDAKFPGDAVYVLGLTRDELGGSEYYQRMGAVGLNVPRVSAEDLLPLYRKLHRAISEGLVASCHAVARGGLAVHLALVAMGGELGMGIDLSAVPAEGSLSPSRTLYSESCGRFVVTVAPDCQKDFEGLLRGLPVGRVGVTTESPRLVVRDAEGGLLMEEDVIALKTAWKRPFGGLV